MLRNKLIVIPCYNEEKRLVRAIEKIRNWNLEDFLILFVDDGSTDKTFSILKSYENEKLLTLQLNKNEGKGFAIQQGFQFLYEKKLIKDVDKFCYMDVDLSVNLNDVEKMFIELEKEENDMIYSSRAINKSIERSFFRGFFSKIFNFFVRLLFKIPVNDTQCGAKVFNLKVLGLILEREINSGWLFDLELFLYCKNLYLKFKPFYIESWLEEEGSKFLIVRHSPGLVSEFLKIYLAFKNNKYI